MTPEEIERGLRELGLLDDKTRLSLAWLSRLTTPENRQKYETITAAHTCEMSKELKDAELEPGS